MQHFHDFIKEHHINLDCLYLDKFYATTQEDRLIYVSEELLKWMGYGGTAFHCKDKLKSRLTSGDEYVLGVDYYDLSNVEYEKYLSSPANNIIGSLICSTKSLVSAHTDTKIISDVTTSLAITDDDTIITNRDLRIYPEIERSRGKATTRHYLLTETALKMIMMTIDTTRGREVRRYFSNLERTFRLFLIYMNKREQAKLTLALTEAHVQIDEQNKRLNHIHKCMKDVMPLVESEYIYIVTSITYARSNQFKIGRTKSVSSRVSSLNTSNVEGEDDVYCCGEFVCHNSKVLEAIIHDQLKRWRTSKSREFFTLHYDILLPMVTQICENYNAGIGRANNNINNWVDIDMMEPVIPTQLPQYMRIKPVVQLLTITNNDVDTNNVDVPYTHTFVGKTADETKIILVGELVKYKSNPKKRVNTWLNLRRYLARKLKSYNTKPLLPPSDQLKHLCDLIDLKIPT